MKDLYLLNYNNYANRVIKKFDNLTDYLPYSLGEPAQNINFNPNDGVNTTQLLNARYADLGTPNYLIITDCGYDEIESRWFVLKATRTRLGQYNLVLKRDTVADTLDAVLDASSFITRGYVKPSSPLIYNREGIQFNQVKQSEVLLKDSTGVPWIVGYISPDVAADQGTITGDIEGYYDVEYTSISQYPYYDNTVDYVVADDSTFIAAPVVCYNGKTMCMYIQSGDVNNNYSSDVPNGERVYTTSQTVYDETVEAWGDLPYAHRAFINQTIDNRIGYGDMIDLRNEVGKTIKVGSKFYKVELISREVVVKSSIAIGSATDIFVNGFFEDWKKSLTADIQYTAQRFAASQLQLRGTEYKLVLNEVSGVEDTTSFTLDATSTTISNSETPYGIICMPYSGNYNVHKSDGTAEPSTLSGANRLKIIQAFGTISGLLYDIQILPYCPIRNLVFDVDDGIIETSTIRSIPVVSTTGTYITSILVAQNSTFSFVIDDVITIEDVKKANETEMYRLNSPNYATSFEFNPAKFFEGDYDVIKYFNVDCSYKPYSPYVHIAPNFSGLYAKDFNDARGLICGGDFSIDRLTDAWETYQYDNKNYQLQFDRQIETMEIDQKWSNRSAAVNGAMGVLGGIAGGAIVGGVGGAAVGAVAGVVDAGFNIAETMEKNADSINAAKDQQAYSLGNIKAQPYGLSKISALNGNNKLFPFLEYYTCTDEESEVLDNFLEYNGMTVMRIGKISDYVDNTAEKTYVKANIIKISDDLKLDYNFVSDVQKELITGVYIYND